MSLLIGGTIAGALYTLVALGLILIVRVTGAINFAQGDAGSVGAFVAIQLIGPSVGLSVTWSVIVGIVCGSLVNLLIYLLFVRRLEVVGAGPMPTMVVTIGASLIIEALLTLKFGFNPYTIPLFRTVGAIRVFGVLVPGSGSLIVASALLAIGIFALVLYRTNFGRMLRMGASNPELAELCGVRTTVIRMIVWAVAGAVASWGVILYASYQTISTSVMGGFLMTAAVAASWGAFRSLGLTLLGAVALGVILDEIARYVQYDITYVITFAVLAIVYLVYQVRRGRLASRLDGSESRVHRSWLTREVRPSYRTRPGLIVVESILVLIALLVWLSVTGSGSYDQGLAMQVGAAMVALAGLSVSFRYARRLSLGAGGFMCFGAYAYSVVGAHTSAFVAVLFAVAGSFVIGFLLGLLTAGMELMFYATLTLVFTTAMPELVTTFPGLTGGSEGLNMAPKLLMANPAWMIVLVGVGSAVAVVVAGNSRRGSQTLIAGGDRRLAHANGIHDVVLLSLAEGFGGLILGLAGVVLAISVGYVGPASFDLSLSVGFIAALIIGGSWSVIGITLGALFYVMVPAELSSFQGYPDVVYGAVLIVAVLVAPIGLEGVTTWLAVERHVWARNRVGLKVSGWVGRRYGTSSPTLEGSAISLGDRALMVNETMRSEGA